MKQLLLAGLLLAGMLKAQAPTFEKTVEVIQRNIRCCSVPFAASTSSKVEDIGILKNGTITLEYNGKKPKQTFNIFKLYKEAPTATGIDTILKGKFIQFYVNEKQIRLIRFNSREKTSEVFAAFQTLMNICEPVEAVKDSIRINQLINLINKKLIKWSESGNTNISANQDGDLIISDKGIQTFRFNSQASTITAKLVYCDKKLHAPLAWINFYQQGKVIAFIRMKCQVPDKELESLQQAFTQLHSLLIAK